MQVDDAHDTDVVMTMYNLIQYSNNYSKTSGILWQHYRNEPAINVANGDIVDFNATNVLILHLKLKKKIADKTDNKRWHKIC